jgi:16S rRNA (cytosine967-C5)-methyltransferase
MTPSARLQAVLELLTQIDATPRPADALVSAYFRARRYIGSKDRAYVSTTLYDVLRHRARLGWWLGKIGTAIQSPLPLGRGLGRGPDTENAVQKPPPNLPSRGEEQFDPRLILIAYLVLVESKSADAAAGLFGGGKFAPPVLTDAERATLRKLATHTLDHPEMPDEVKGECPDWAAASLKKRFGKNLLTELQAMLRPAPLDLRVNPLKAERDAMLAEIKKKIGLKAEACRMSPYGIRVEERPSLNTLPMLKNGQIEIQDEGSQMVALLVDARPGERVVDFCAGAGGKTLAIAAMMKNKGRIIACDVLEGRLKRSTERFRRAGLHNIEVKPLSSESDPWVKRHKGGFDRVLVDAPCSGTGTWRRNPDSRWKHLGPDLSELLTLQGKILASAARLVKPGGRLVYATCSLLAEENDQQIDAFLAAHPEYKRMPASEVLKHTAPHLKFPCPDPYLALTPAQHDTDGFFAAVMERIPTETAEDK